MLLSSVRLTISNPGFTLGYEPEAKLSRMQHLGVIFVDLLLFLMHPIILQFKISSLKIQKKAIDQSFDMNLSAKYSKNLMKIIRLEQQYFSYKRLELNLETIYQMTISLLLYFYSTSETTTTNSLKAGFSEEYSENEGAFQGWTDFYPNFSSV